MSNIPSLPHDLNAEQSIIGSMLISTEAVSKACEQLAFDSFYSPQHRLIFELMFYMNVENKAIDITTLSGELRDKNKLQEIGGVEYLYELYSAVPSTANVDYYIQIVERHALRRRLLNVVQEIGNHVLEDGEEIEDVLDFSEQRILSVANSKKTGQFKSMSDILERTFDHLEILQQQDGAITGLTTGFTDLDNQTAGLHGGDLIIVGARPAMGKTAFALNIARNVTLKNDASVAIFSLEMGAEQLALRFLSAEGKVESEKLRNGKLSSDDIAFLNIARDNLANSKLFVDDTPGISIGEIRAKCRRLKQEHGLNLVVIDYLQLIHGNIKGSNRQEEVSYISRSLKALARELEIPVIALSQLSRAVESRTDKRPMMSDIRESGSIEQDADIVAFLYRDDYYDRESETSDQIEIIIGKHRNGPVGTISLAFLKNYNLFENLASSDTPGLN
ncbi:MAG: replicative DNA helicase [Culicoidibacterales bacterium]